MCGINGYLSKNPADALLIESKLKVMNQSIIHRGPDQDGFYVDTSADCTIGMAMRRLSIIDLSSGQQPIFNKDSSKIIVFNGEIYNFLTLRAELEKEGVAFLTNSDTEVILKLYEKYGVASFSRLDGMFAFSIYDKTLNKLFIARDFFGEKPLYYTRNQDGFIWGSELKSILKVLVSKPAINREALNLFLQLTYIPAPYSIFETIHKLEANHYIEFDCSNFDFQMKEINQQFKSYSAISKEEALQKTRDLVQQSVLSRSISDVPLGTFLSGGVDSSIVSLCLSQQTQSKIDTFSIGFEKKSFDETDKSRLVAKMINSNHHEFIISDRSLTDQIDDIILNFDEPFADSSALASYVVAQMTKKHVTVALTGDGGDEVFGGYNKYYMGKLNARYTSLIPEMLHKGIVSSMHSILKTTNDNRGKRFKFNKLLKAINYSGDYYYAIISLGYPETEIKDLLKEHCYQINPLSYYKEKIGNKTASLTDFRNIDRVLSLEGDMLVKVDRTSMLTSLESRAPFLNKEIWNFTSQLPEHYLLKGWDKKHLLKESFKSYFPKDFLNKSKKGFGVPVGDWLRGVLKIELLTFIDKKFIEEQNIFNFDSVSKLVLNHVNSLEDNSFKVWTFYCFQKWYRNYFEK
jgi:asparagine synthase (glutamine-hydrolysing)